MVADTSLGGAMEGEQEGTSEDSGLISLNILPLLKERQQQHGLRHGDYQRYHGYCSRKLRRLRETLKIPQGDKRHFKKKDITVTEIDSEKADSRHLEIPLTVTERAWASAMQLKQDSNTESRKKFHMQSRLKKSVTYAASLLTIADESSRMDARTKLECEAYAAFINAVYNFEREQWKEAMACYQKTQAIYNQISQALGDVPESAVYAEKIAEILPAMRFCTYKTGTELKISDLDSQYQSAAIEEMMAQRPKMTEVPFRNYKVAIPNEKVATIVVRIEEFEKQEEKTVDMYDQILIALRDMIQTVRDSMKTDQPSSTKGKPPMLLSYLLYLRLKLTNSRTELMIEEKSQAKDKIRFVDMIIHNYSEMKTIPGLEIDEDFQGEVDDQSTLYQGIRCRYIADVYRQNRHWEEALHVYRQCNDHLARALKGLPPNSAYAEQGREHARYSEGVTVECTAQNLVVSMGEDDELFKYVTPEIPLSERLDEYVLDETLVTDKPMIMTVPPEMRPIHCKPLFFDLACDHIDYPMDKIQEKARKSSKSPKKDGAAGGLSGLVKGLWGWGK